MKHNVRVRGGFSDRNSFNPIPKTEQINSFTSETRTVLYNCLSNLVAYQIELYNLDPDLMTKCIVENLFNEVYKGKYNQSLEDIMNDLLDIITNDEFHVVLTVIEFIINLIYQSKDRYHAINHFDFLNQEYVDVREKMNESFENEFVGYRFIDDRIIGITSKEEIGSIEDAINTPYEMVNKSIAKSLSMISESGSKDYYNSIKESIMAVEQLFIIMLGTNGLVLSNAIEQYCQKHKFNEHLKESIKELYKYTSDVNGIRHGNNKKEEKVSFGEAKYVLLICSSTINYLLSLK